jgi:hypothetical protein
VPSDRQRRRPTDKTRSSRTTFSIAIAHDSGGCRLTSVIMSTVIDDGYREAARLIRQLQDDLDAIKSAQPGSETHRKAITAYTATYARLGRSPYTKHVAFPLPPDQAFEA